MTTKLLTKNVTLLYQYMSSTYTIQYLKIEEIPVYRCLERAPDEPGPPFLNNQIFNK